MKIKFKRTKISKHNCKKLGDKNVSFDVGIDLFTDDEDDDATIDAECVTGVDFVDV